MVRPLSNLSQISKVISIKLWNCGCFSKTVKNGAAPTSTVIRHIEAGAHRGLEPYEGTYFKADFDAMLQMAPPYRDKIPILVAAMREKIVRMGAEIADGVIGHAMWSIDWTINQMMPIFMEELEKHGRDRKDVIVSIWPWVAINDDKAEAIEDARSSIAYYASAKQYESFFEGHGYLSEARACQAGIEADRDISTFKQHVPDEMVETFVATGPMDEVAAKLEPLWTVANHLCPAPPLLNLAPEKIQVYSERIGQFVASQTGAAPT